MTTELRKDLGEIKQFTPSEEVALKSFGLISKKEFEKLPLSEGVVFSDPNFGPDPIEGREQVINALNYGFETVKQIEFKIKASGEVTLFDKVETGEVGVVVITDTHTVTSMIADEKVDSNIGQAFFFRVRNEDGKFLLSKIVAYPQNPPPGE